MFLSQVLVVVRINIKTEQLNVGMNVALCSHRVLLPRTGTVHWERGQQDNGRATEYVLRIQSALGIITNNTCTQIGLHCVELHSWARASD